MSGDDRQSPAPLAAVWSDYLVLDLGRISVYNEFFLSEQEHAVTGQAGLVSRAPLERIHLSLARVNLLRATAAPSPPSLVAGQPSLSALQSMHSEAGGARSASSAAAAMKRSASHDALRYPSDTSGYGDGLPLSPPLNVHPSALAPVFVVDAGHQWESSTKVKLVEDMDIQVELVSPLAQLRFAGVDAFAVHGDLSTVHVNVNERLYAFLLSMYRHDIQPLITLTDPPTSAAVPAPAPGFDGGSVLIEEQWGLEQEEPRVPRRQTSSSPLHTIDEKAEVKEEAAGSAPTALLPADSTSVNLSFREIFIDVHLSPAVEGAEDITSQHSGSPTHRGEGRAMSQPLRFSFIEEGAPATVEPLPFAHIRASTLQLSARLTYDRSAAAVTRSEFECSVARLSVQDSRVECSHPLFRQVIGGHKDDLSQSTARAISKRRGASSTFTTPTSSLSSHVSAASVIASPLLTSQHLSVDWSTGAPPPVTSAAPLDSAAVSFSHHSRLFPSQILLSPLMPKSPTRSPLPLYHRPSAALGQAVHAPLPPTILPDLLISGQQEGDEQISVSVDFTAPRLVLSPGCIAAVQHAAGIFARITEALLTKPSMPPRQPSTMSFSSGYMDTASPTFTQAAGTQPPSSSASQPAARSPAPSPSASPRPSPTPVRVQLAIYDPQVWLMADAATDDSSFDPTHLTSFPSDAPASSQSSAPSSLVHPTTSASIRRGLHLPPWPADSPNSPGLSDDEDLPDDDPLDSDDASAPPPRPTKPPSHAGPRSLSCLVLRTQVKVEATLCGDDVHAAVDVTELQALVCYRAHHLRLALLSLPPVPIFEPLHLHLDYSAQADPDADLTSPLRPLPIEHIVVSLSTLDACFSFLQISTAASILHGLNRVLPPDFFVSKRSLEAAALSASGYEDPAAAAVVAPLSTFKGSVQLQTAGLELAIVNDAPGYYVPLLRFTLPTLTLSMTEGMRPEPAQQSVPMATSAVVQAAAAGRRSSFSWPFSSAPSPASSTSPSLATPAGPALKAGKAAAGVTFALSITAGGSYYNSEIQQWESLFEPWPLDVSGDDGRITATSAHMFRLSISPSAIHTLARGVASFNTHFLPTITALMASQDAPPALSDPTMDSLTQATTPPRHSSAHSSPVSGSRKTSLFSPSKSAIPGLSDLKRLPSSRPPPPASSDKASYFLVRNETGSRLQFWSVESGLGDNPRPANQPVTTLDSGEQRTVEMRQYLGLGAGANAAHNPGDRQWLHRSPALGLRVEAGKGSGRWDGWNAIDFVSLAAAEESTKAVAGLLSLEEQKTDESIAGLTVHRLVTNCSAAFVPEHMRQSSVDGVAQLVSSLSSLPTLTSNPNGSPVFPPLPASELDPSIVPDTWLACRLVSGADAEGSSAKVLVVSSALLAVNRTFLDLDVQLLDTVRGTVLYSALLMSGQSASLPLLSVPSRHVRLDARPSAGAGAGAGNEWAWSENGPRLSFLRQKAYQHSTVRCESAPRAKGGEGSHGTPHCFYARLNVFRSTPSPITSVDSFAHSASASALPVQSTAFPSAYPDDGVWTVAFDPPLAYKNLLGCELDYRISCRELADAADAADPPLESLLTTLSSSGSLPHRQEVHWYGLDVGLSSSCVVTLSIRRASSPSASHTVQVRAQRALSTSSSASSLSPFVGDSFRYLTESDHRFLSAYRHHWSAEWSEPVIIHSTLTALHSRRLQVASSIPLKDRDGQLLQVHLDYSESSISSLGSSALSSSSAFSSRTFPFAGAGPGLVTCYVPYWIYNNTGLPLVVGTVGRYSDSEMAPGQSPEEIERRAASLLEKEDALHRDLTAEQWFTFADSRRQHERAKGLQLLIGEDDAAHVAGATFTGWHPALRSRPYDQPPFLLSYPPMQLRLLPDTDDPTAALPFPPAGEKSRRACIRLPNTDWSKPFSVDAVGTHGALELEEELPPSHLPRPFRLYEFGVSVSLHPNPRFHRSKTLLIHPRVLFHNLTGHSLQLRQVGTAECSAVGVQEQVAVHRYDAALKSRLSLRFAAYGWQWCARRYGLAVDEVGSRFVRLRNAHTHEIAVLRVDTRLVQATFEVSVFVAWEQEDAPHPSARAQHSARAHPASPDGQLSASLLVSRHASAPYFDPAQRPGLSSPSTPSPVSPPHYSAYAASAAAHHPLSTAEALHRSATLQTPPAYSYRHSTATPPPPPADDDAAQLGRGRAPYPAQRADAVPYRLENYSLHTLLFYQIEEDALSARILPYRAAPYAWDEPDGVKELVIAVVDPVAVQEEARSGHAAYATSGKSRPRVLGRYSLDRIVRYPPVSLHSDAASGAPATARNQLGVNVYADGRVRVLRVSDVHSAASLPPAAGPAASAGSGHAAAVEEGGPALLSVHLHLAGVAVSLISHAMTAGAGSNLLLTRDRASHALHHVLDVAVARPGRLDPPVTRQELLHLQLSGLDARLRRYKDRVAVDTEVGRVQVDNQLHTAVFPVVFCPVLMKQEAGAASAPSFLAVSVVQSLDKSRADLLFFPYLAVRMAKMQLHVEEQLVAYLLHFAQLVSPAFASSSQAAGAQSSLPPPTSTVLPASAASINSASHVSSDLVVSSSALLTAQKRRTEARGEGHRRRLRLLPPRLLQWRPAPRRAAAVVVGLVVAVAAVRGQRQAPLHRPPRTLRHGRRPVLRRRVSALLSCGRSTPPPPPHPQRLFVVADGGLRGGGGAVAARGSAAVVPAGAADPSYPSQRVVLGLGVAAVAVDAVPPLTPAPLPPSRPQRDAAQRRRRAAAAVVPRPAGRVLFPLSADRAHPLALRPPAVHWLLLPTGQQRPAG